MSGNSQVDAYTVYEATLYRYIKIIGGITWKQALQEDPYYVKLTITLYNKEEEIRAKLNNVNSGKRN